MIGVTHGRPLPGPGWNFVFGEARFHDRVGVYSFARYDPAFYGEPREPGTDKHDPPPLPQADGPRDRPHVRHRTLRHYATA
jgi:hypothetical protein